MNVRPRNRSHFGALCAVAALALAACSGGTSSAPPGTAGASHPSLPACPIGALRSATKPVQITVWHGLTRANETTLQQLAAKFNGSQGDVHVNLVNQTSYDDDFNKFVAGLSSGDLPDVVQMEDVRLQQMIDTKAILPAQSCVDADKYDTSDFLPRVIHYYSQQGVLYPMPFNVSNPVFFYDKNAFTKAGLDPNTPPATLDDIKADAVKLKAAGVKSPFAFKLDPWYIEQWSAKAGVDITDNANGRTGRATKATFDNATGLQIFSWMHDMVTSGLASTNSASGPDQFNNLLAIGNHASAMTIDSSATLGTITQVLASGSVTGVSLGVAAMPGPVGQGGVLVGGAALYLSLKSSPAKQDAAWQFLKFLDQPDNQATFAAGTGYVPIRKTAVVLPAIQQIWATIPGYKVAYDQLIRGVENDATAGAVIGGFADFRHEVLSAEQQMFTQGMSPASALQQAQTAATTKIQDYNARVGG
jgi:sn-glycerol 3-phosphate transport system substrate-binding protein